jgi:hypothetical protein
MTDVNAVLGLALAVNEPREEVMVAEIQGILACAVGRRATVTEMDFKQDLFHWHSIALESPHKLPGTRGYNDL